MLNEVCQGTDTTHKTFDDFDKRIIDVYRNEKKKTTTGRIDTDRS